MVFRNPATGAPGALPCGEEPPRGWRVDVAVPATVCNTAGEAPPASAETPVQSGSGANGSARAAFRMQVYLRLNPVLFLLLDPFLQFRERISIYGHGPAGVHAFSEPDIAMASSPETAGAGDPDTPLRIPGLGLGQSVVSGTLVPRVCVDRVLCRLHICPLIRSVLVLTPTRAGHFARSILSGCQVRPLGLITDTRQPITDAGRPARRSRRVP